MSTHRDETRERKRARFDRPDQAAPKTTRNLVIGAAVLIAALAAGALYFTSTGSGDRIEPRPSADRHDGSTAPRAAAPNASPAPTSTLTPDGDLFRVPASQVTSEAAFFTASVGEKTVPFFAVRDASGQAHVALDACQVCAHAKKGYAQKGDSMQCRNCGLTFPIKSITSMAGKGGCHPISLPSKVEGDSILVSRSAVEAGAKWFSVSGTP